MKRIALAASLLPLVCGGALAAPAAPCSLEGLDWRSHPIFQTPEMREQSVSGMACRTTATRDVSANGLSFVLAMGELIEPASSGEPTVHALRVASLFRRDGDALAPLGHFLVGPDPLDGGLAFAPETHAVEGGVATQLSPRNPSLYVVTRDRAAAAAAFGWVAEAAKRLPAGLAAGQPLGLELGALRGRVAVHRAGSDDPAHPGSAYEEDRMLVADLAWRDGALAVVATRIEPRPKGVAAEEPIDAAREGDEEARKALTSPPPGVEPCDLGAWSKDKDPKGLNVRAEPSAKARIVGIVPPPRRTGRGEEAETYRSEFRIVGYREGWFLVDSIEAPGKNYIDSPYPAALPQPYRGRGWVRGTMVGAAYAYGGLPQGRLYDAPHADATWRPAKAEGERAIAVGDEPKAILACSGRWALVDTAGARGWVRSLCSNQVTNCS